jgi:hypothetical protein
MNGLSSTIEYSLPSVSTRHVFSDHDMTSIKNLYSRLFSVPIASLFVPKTYMQYSTMKINNKQIGTFSSLSSNASIVLALWIPVLTSSGVSGEPEKRPARVNFFVKHSVQVGDMQHTIISVCVSWFKKHPHNTEYGKPVTVWEPDTFEIDSRYHIIPIQFIAHRTVSLIDTIDGLGNALFVIPCINF